jgi:hypothetical protein
VVADYVKMESDERCEGYKQHPPHGYNATIFAYPYDDGSANKTVVDTIARYYNLARAGTDQGW